MMKPMKETKPVNTYLSKLKVAWTSNEEEAAAYIALKMLYDKMLTKDKDKIEICVNAQSLYYELSGSLNVNRTSKAKLEEGIQGLVENEFIKLIDTDNHGNFIIDIAGLMIDSTHEPYITMTQEEIRSIFNISYKQRFNLLRFAVVVFGTINSESKCGYMSYDKMRWGSGIQSKTTCVTLLRVLEENNILYVRHSDTIQRDKTGEIKNLPNCYGRPCNKKEIDAFYDDLRKRRGHDFTNNMSPERKSRLTKNYKKYMRGAYEGDVVELIKECLIFNKIPYNELNPEWQKDLSIFPEEMIEIAKEELKERKTEGKQKVQEQEEKQEEKTSQAEDYKNSQLWKEMAAEAEKINKAVQKEKEREEKNLLLKELGIDIRELTPDQIKFLYKLVS